MKQKIGIIVVIAAMAFAAGLAGARVGSSQSATSEVKVIEMTAKKYEYSQSEIRVKKGTRVQLKIRATDRTHGFKIAIYPEGSGNSGDPGLKFDPPQDTWRLEENQETVIEFVAQKAGSYPFKCTVFCGMGHKGMKGVLIVEE